MTSQLDNTTEPGLTVFVPGTPRPQGSKRPLRNKHTGKIHMIESSKDVGTWREDIRQAVRRQLADATQLDNAVQVGLTFTLKRPKSHYRTGRNAHLLRDTAPKHPIGKPDVDKLTRAVLDAIGSASVWRDDAQVVALIACKRYADPGVEPGVRIAITTLEPIT